MNGLANVRSIPWVLSIAALALLGPAVHAQEGTAETPGIKMGDYNVQQSVEFGWRASYINGNQNTYDTFDNLHSGLRLFDYTVDMHSINHRTFVLS